MADKSHLLFRNPTEGVVTYRPLTRAVFPEQDETTPDYTLMQENFSAYRANLIRDRQRRHENRTLEILQHIDYIELHFFGPFDYERYANHYRADFGLVSVKFSKFNTVGLFAITDEGRFADFLDEIQSFVNAQGHTGELTYDVNIRYIREFYLLTSEKIKAFEQLQSTVLFNLVESEELLVNVILPIEDLLQQYLRQQNLRFSYNPSNRTIQVWDAALPVIETLIGNFDIIHSVNSSLTGIILPGPFGMPIRSFGFTVTPPPQNAPSIAILDTGVSDQTPLSAIIRNQNNQYDLAGGGSRVDNFDGLRGHGTAVASFAALGRKLIPDHIGAKTADAWIVSVKILREGSPRVSDVQILNTIRQVHTEQGTRIFVLTITETICKKTDECASAFAYSLDLLAHELDILIVISAGNVRYDQFFDIQTGAAIHHYPNDFLEDYTNIKSPAESMNNLSLGACAANFEDGINDGIALDGTFPAIYTSKFHYNFHDGLLNSKQRNNYIRKPDIIYNGGDWNATGNPDSTGLKHISARNGEFFLKNTGTSFSAPLIANIAAQICAQYPDLRMQTVKGLIINTANRPEVGDFLNALPETVQNHLLGYGIPDTNECLYSDDNSATMVLEDEISPDRIKSYNLNIPAYLLEKENRRTVLDVKMTLCFSFEPILNNQMAYCPIHIGFGLFKNLPLQATRSVPDEDGVEVIEDVGLNHNKSENIKIKTSGPGWSEDYYFRMKLLSNTQRLELVFNKDDIRGNDNKFKIAVNCLRHKLLTPGQRDHYNVSHKFSLVINVKERPLAGVLQGNMYNELMAINTLNVIADLEAEAEV